VSEAATSGCLAPDVALWDKAGMSKAFQTALVTGGASGIGAAAVRLLEAEGVEVRSLDLATGFDVADAGAWEGIGPVDFAFLNAGVATGEDDVAGISDSAYRRAVGANVDGVVFGVRRMAQVMEPGSAIVVTASLAGLMAMPLDPIYSLTKHAVVGFVRAAAPQLAAKQITINALCPSFADTPIVTDELRKWVAGQGWSLITAEAVAEAALAAARSEETGQAWVVQIGREPMVYEFRGVPGPR
jgi:NAD(P)-dependent dehydrogenase (short-subunit alcohol dehydrogenase family)